MAKTITKNNHSPTLDIWMKSLLAEERPQMGFKADVKLKEHMRANNTDLSGKSAVYEFIQPEDFGVAWTTRQRYEVDAGRDSEPLLYQPLYDIMEDESFPSAVQINRLGPGGVVLSELLPGGETKFATIGAGTQVIPIRDYTVGLEYSMRMVEYNELWDVAIFERQAGIANNALLNHLHLFPFIDYAYTAANQTAASAVGTTLEEKYIRTLEDAIASAHSDPTNPRRGPYYLLTSIGNFFTAERALNGNVVNVSNMQSSARSMIRGIIAYDGWTGIMNGETTTFPGVPAGKAYLIDVNPSLKMAYARSLIKFILRKLQGNEDVSRLVALQEVLWTAVGVYTNPAALAEEITLPTA